MAGMFDRFSGSKVASQALSRLRNDKQKLMEETEVSIISVATAAAYGAAVGNMHGDGTKANMVENLFAKTHDDGTFVLDANGVPESEGVPASLVVGGALKALQFLGGDLLKPSSGPGYERQLGAASDTLLGLYAFDVSRKFFAARAKKAADDKAKQTTTVPGEQYAPFGSTVGSEASVAPHTDAERAAYDQAVRAGR